MPNVRSVLLFILVSLFALLGLSGCGSSQQNSSIPWGRPQEWEGRIPGMGS